MCLKKTIRFIAVLLVIIAPGNLYAKDGKFAFSVTSGYYTPSLTTLNNILTKSRFAISEDPNFLLPGPVSPTINLEDRNLNSGSFSGNNTYGIEIEWEAHKKHSLLLSLGVWEEELVAQDIYDLPLRTSNNPLPTPRFTRYNLEISQLWLGWKYNFIKKELGKAGKVRMFTTIELFGVSLAYLTMDSLLKVNAPAQGQNFASISSTEAFGVGYTSRFGLGGEAYISKWISISGKASYIIGKVAKLHIERYFAASFPPDINTNTPQGSNSVDIQPPETLVKGDTIFWGVDNSQNIERRLQVPQFLELELNGIEFNLALMFHF